MINEPAGELFKYEAIIGIDEHRLVVLHRLVTTSLGESMGQMDDDVLQQTDEGWLTAWVHYRECFECSNGIDKLNIKFCNQLFICNYNFKGYYKP